MAAADGLRRSVKGLSEAEFRERFGTEEACRQALFDMRWRDGLTCPGCGGSSFCRLKTRELFQCNRCKRQVRRTHPGTAALYACRGSGGWPLRLV